MQTLGSHFIPRELRPLGWNISPRDFAISMHPSQCSCNTILFYEKYLRWNSENIYQTLNYEKISQNILISNLQNITSMSIKLLKCCHGKFWTGFHLGTMQNCNQTQFGFFTNHNLKPITIWLTIWTWKFSNWNTKMKPCFEGV